MFYLEDILNFIDDNNDDLSSLFKNIEGYSTPDLEKRLAKRLLRIKKIHLLGSQFKENQKGRRKGKRFMYSRQIKDAFNDGKIDLVKALITYARVDFKMSKMSRQTLWRLKKELLEVGISEEIVTKLYHPE